MRECARQASDLNGCRVTCVETQQRRLAGRGRVEDRRACRVGPKDAIGIRAPQPYRRRSERLRCQPRVKENCKLRRRVRHRGVATIWANKDLIRVPAICVHASAGAIQRQAPVALMHADSRSYGPGRASYGHLCNAIFFIAMHQKREYKTRTFRQAIVRSCVGRRICIRRTDLRRANGPINRWALLSQG